MWRAGERKTNEGLGLDPLELFPTDQSNTLDFLGGIQSSLGSFGDHTSPSSAHCRKGAGPSHMDEVGSIPWCVFPLSFPFNKVQEGKEQHSLGEWELGRTGRQEEIFGEGHGSSTPGLGTREGWGGAKLPRDMSRGRHSENGSHLVRAVPSNLRI